MTKLTIALDEATLERARCKASQQGASLDALVRGFLEKYAGGEDNRDQAVRALLHLSRVVESGSGGRRWTREDLHDR